MSANQLYWLGGSPCGGKSSVADWLSHHHHIGVYHIDDHINRHLVMITPEEQPALYRWQTRTWDERWLQPHDRLLKDAIDCYTEHFHLLLPEVLEIARAEPLIVEGNPLLPTLIQPYLAHPSHVTYLVAPPALLRKYYQQRNWAGSILKQCSDPEQAFHNWMERDIAFAHYIEEQSLQYQMSCLISDDKMSIESKAKKVAEHFGFDSGL